MRLAIIAAAFATLALPASPALATTSHVFTTTFGATASSPANPYPISGPTDVAVDQETNDLYVTDPANHRVEKFDSAGNFVLMFGKGVNKTKVEEAGSTEAQKNVCTAASGDTCQAGTSASTSGALEVPTYLAVDSSGGPSSGDVYVADNGDNIVQKFHPTGQIVTSWGSAGQKDGTDATDLPVYGQFFGLDVGADGTLYIAGLHYSRNIWLYKQDGTYIRWTGTGGGFFAQPGMKVDSAGNIYFVSTLSFVDYRVWKAVNFTSTPMTSDWPTTGYGFDPANGEFYQGTGVREEQGVEIHGPRIDHYNNQCEPFQALCDPVDSFGNGHLFDAKGLAVDGSSGTVYVVNSATNDIAVFGDVRPKATTGPPTDVTETSVTLTGHVDPAGHGDITECHFEYGFDTNYGATVPCTPDPASNPPGSNFTAPTDVTATISGLSAGTRDHYRLVVGNNADATKAGADQTFVTTAPPAIDGLSSEGLTATTADLLAQVNPNGLETTYRFEYGTSPEYGQVAPVPDGTLEASNSDQPVAVHLTNLVTHVVYHYTLVAENEDGVTRAEDHTFSFYPPACPNENVRQQTQANFLPDCRAYELVSPSDAGGTQLFANGPNTGFATDPSRFAYTGVFSTIPNSGGSPIDGNGDLYVATRTSTGWVTRYVGWPSNEAAVNGGPAMGPPGSTPGPIRDVSNMASNGGHGQLGQNGVLTDLSMDRFLSFNDGNQSIGSIFGSDFQNKTVIASNAPRVFAADGGYLDRWPTNLGTVPDGSYPPGSNIYPHGGDPYEGEEPAEVAPGGARALDCPLVVYPGVHAASFCPGDVTASADLTHFVFASEWNVFAPGGQLNPPGSVYDNDTDASTVAVASKTASGDNIQSEPSDQAGDPLQIPSVSRDGSHILMAAGGTGPCGFSTCPIPPCGEDYSGTKRCQMQDSHLYMRVDGTITYDVSKGHAVDYAGSTPDGSKVYFLSDQELTPDDLDTSTDLYQWNEATDSLTLVSKGNNPGNAGEPGNSDACRGGLVTSHAALTTKCGVATYTQGFYCNSEGGSGGNCISDNSIAADNGDIYFQSPELLDGSHGIPNQANLYDFRNGQVQYVTTLKGSPTCYESYSINTCAHILRMQVTHDDSFVSFITASPVTQYDNAGHLEMYRYEPATRHLVCVSCIPDGSPPSSDVQASQDGLFMSSDGRVFFSTEDPLVHVDTNHALDVYEYVEGRPQLITLGTGDTRRPSGGLGFFGKPGLVGVSADGQDVYFATYDSLVRQDHNGLFLKFYDARSGGGFSAPAPPPPCEAADECHGPASGPPPPMLEGTGSSLEGGNTVAKAGRKSHRRGKRHRRKGHRAHHSRPAEHVRRSHR